MILDNHSVENACHIRHIEFAAAWGVQSCLEYKPGEAFEKLKDFTIQNQGSYLFGFLGYDLKNETENLSSVHPDPIGFPPMYFFVPQFCVVIDAGFRIIEGVELALAMLTEADSVESQPQGSRVHFHQRVSKEEYIRRVNQIRDHIREGDVYELNYCVEFYSEQTVIQPLEVYRQLSLFSPTPFGALMRWYDRYLICASPERFITECNGTLYSQPIKGTIRRSADKDKDHEQKESLRNSEKEKAENLMIVDLVRNDLARSSQTGSVKVEELYGIYTFRNLHQMISTVSSKRASGNHQTDAIRHAFPMGSMTGAPKVKAMQLIEQYEQTKRGLYSGAVGYVAPNGNFDFNVVIRSLQYHQGTGYLNFEVGSAITYDSNPLEEYDECMLKAEAMMRVLSADNN